MAPIARRIGVRAGRRPEEPVDERTGGGLDVGKRLRRELGRDRLSAVRRRVVLISVRRRTPRGARQ